MDDPVKEVAIRTTIRQGFLLIYTRYIKTGDMMLPPLPPIDVPCKSVFDDKPTSLPDRIQDVSLDEMYAIEEKKALKGIGKYMKELNSNSSEIGLIINSNTATGTAAVADAAVADAAAHQREKSIREQNFTKVMAQLTIRAERAAEDPRLAVAWMMGWEQDVTDMN